MLALMKNAQSTELFLPSGCTVEVPAAVLEGVEAPMEFDVGLRWAFKAGLLTHQEFLASRDLLIRERAQIVMDL